MGSQRVRHDWVPELNWSLSCVVLWALPEKTERDLGCQGSSATYSQPDPGPLSSPMDSHSYWIHNCTTASQHRVVIKGHRTQNVWSMALFLVKVKVKVLVAQSCWTLCGSMDCSPPGSFVHGIFQARILEWVAIPFSRGTSQPRDETQVFYIAGRFFSIWATRETQVCTN